MPYCTRCGRPSDETAGCTYCDSKRTPKEESFTQKLEREMNGYLSKKDPFIAAILSFFFPGLGQLYNGEFKKALVFQTASLVTAFLSVFFFLFAIIPLAIMIAAVYDGYTEADKMRKGKRSLQNPALKEILIFLLWPILAGAGLLMLAFLFVFLIIFAAVIV